VPEPKQGVASSINDLSRELGGALRIAVLGSVLNSTYRSGVAQHTRTLPADLAAKARGSLGAAQAIGHRLGANDVISQANTAFAHGIDLALLTGAAILIVGAIVVAIRAPGQTESRANAGAKHTDWLPDPRQQRESELATSAIAVRKPKGVGRARVLTPDGATHRLGWTTEASEVPLSAFRKPARARQA
jgi:hypothetical protein